MNRDIAEGQWNQIRGKIHQFWGRLTEEEVDQINGHYESLAGKVQEKYGLLKEEADDQVRNFLAYCERLSKAERNKAGH